MKPLIIGFSIALLLSGCASLSESNESRVPSSAPIDELAAKGPCDNNVVANEPGRRGRGSSTVRCTRSITDIGGLLDTLDRRSTLLVLDIDDTLLTSDTFFGSDSWYEWLKSSETPAAAKPACKFDIIALNYEAGTQHAVEGEAGVAFINGLSVPKLLLTSRNPQYRAGTERELLAAKYAFPPNFLDGSDGISWTDTDPTAKPLSVPISYANGVQMTTGRNKGKMLLELLARLKKLKHGQKFKNVILVDDGPQNINAFHAELPKAGYNYYGYWYRKVEKISPEPDSPTAKEAVDALTEWQELIKTQYPNRWSRWQLPDGKGCGV